MTLDSTTQEQIITMLSEDNARLRSELTEMGQRLKWAEMSPGRQPVTVERGDRQIIFPCIELTYLTDERNKTTRFELSILVVGDYGKVNVIPVGTTEGQFFEHMAKPLSKHDICKIVPYDSHGEMLALRRQLALPIFVKIDGQDYPLDYGLAETDWDVRKNNAW